MRHREHLQIKNELGKYLKWFNKLNQGGIFSTHYEDRDSVASGLKGWV